MEGRCVGVSSLPPVLRHDTCRADAHRIPDDIGGREEILA